MYDSETQRPTWAEISLPSLKHNFNVLRQHVSRSVQIMAVVKANAYGHGAVECARTLEDAGADCFAVSLIEEGIELRRAGIMLPIVCLGGFHPRQASLVVEHDLTPVVFDVDAVFALSHEAQSRNSLVNLHIKIDTGMGRLGIAIDKLPEFALSVTHLPNVRIDGVLSHLADADALSTEFTQGQIAEFSRAVEILKAADIKPTFRHLANSAAIHGYPESWENLVRAGAAVYGLRDDVLGPHGPRFDLKPVMSLYSRVTLVKDVPAGASIGYSRTFQTSRPSRIAILPIGYADGYRRALSNRGQVLIRGKVALVIGRISMDLTIIDVTDIAGVERGDKVTLIGSDGGRELRPEELASAIDTVSYEIVCGITSRVPRVYL